MDFQKFNNQAELIHQPKVHAIVMTHCGWNCQKKNTPDNSTRFFVERAIEVAKRFGDVFSEIEISKCFYLLDDFHSSGRISGKQRIPLSKLESGKKYIVDGQRLEVNPSVDRYKRESSPKAGDLSGRLRLRVDLSAVVLQPCPFVRHLFFDRYFAPAADRLCAAGNSREILLPLSDTYFGEVAPRRFSSPDREEVLPPCGKSARKNRSGSSRAVGVASR